MSISIDLSDAILSLLVCLLSVIFVVDGWKMVVMRRRMLLTTHRIAYKIVELFVNKARIEKWKKRNLSGRTPIVFGWFALLGGLFYLLFGIIYFIYAYFI